MKQRTGQPACLGVSSIVPIRVGEKVSVVADPQVRFVGERLYVPADSLDFALFDIRIGKNSQYIDSGPILGEAFGDALEGKLFRAIRDDLARLKLRGGREDGNERISCDTAALIVPPGLAADIGAFGERLRMDVCEYGREFVTVVRNDGPTDRPFRAVYFGIIPDEER